MDSGLSASSASAASSQLQGLEAVLEELASGPGSPARQTEIEEALTSFKAQPDALELALAFLYATRSAYVHWYCASVVEYKLQAEWAQLSAMARATVGSQLANFLAERHHNHHDEAQLTPFALSKLLTALVGVGMADADATLQLLQVIVCWCALPTAPRSPPPWAPAVDSAHEGDEADSRQAQLRRNHLGLAAARVLAEELAARRYPGAQTAQRVVEDKVRGGGKKVSARFPSSTPLLSIPLLSSFFLTLF